MEIEDLEQVVEAFERDIPELEAFLAKPRIDANNYVVGLDGVFFSAKKDGIDVNPLHVERYTKTKAQKLAALIETRKGKHFEVIGIHEAARSYLTRCKSVVSSVRKSHH